MWKSVLLLSVLCPLVSCVCTGCTDYTPVDLDDPGFKEAVNLVLSELSKHHTSKYHQKIVEITDAEKSVCSVEKLCGDLASYRLNATVGLTNCLKSEVSYESVEECELQENAKILNCKIEVAKDKKGEFSSISTSCRYERKS